ncbi:YjiH family protein [Fervidibacillus halotolerans]|uniref:YjiH family protein n=1 Tax=Fervidibacillus halotolerans TaxID=2980027 RepID=A0A9E8S148_9BACI|nr:YjiH family protein [Fervidibacillus halotolerans]WAA13157.1 YjiH family protein [Fervidibacillus halotolerans]
MDQIQTGVPELKSGKPSSVIPFFKFIIFSLIGIFMFFVPITLNNRSSIPLDHIVTWIRNTFPEAVPFYLLVTIAFGAIHPFIQGNWKKDGVHVVLSIFKIIGLVVASLIVFEIGPKWLFEPDMGPFLFNSLVASVGVLVPIGAVFLSLLTGYGLLEFIGVIMQPIMRPIWKTPGRSAIDAVASFVGSYSIGLLITNRIFKEGKYSIKEAAIIATGFSTVSATFMIVVAKTLDLMEIWNTYFWVTLFVTFFVTAITVRLHPLRNMSNGYFNNMDGNPEEVIKKHRMKEAWNQAMEVSRKSSNFVKTVWIHLKDGYLMTTSILPSIMSIGLLGLVLAEYTPVFDLIGYIFYPFTWLVQLPDASLAAKAASMGIAEMFLPALLVVDAALITKFVIGVVSVSSIIFFSAVVPVILSTEIPISISKMVFIWFERTVLTILITTPIAYLLL